MDHLRNTMPNQAILSRVLRIKSAFEGAATIIDYHDNQYIVTAAHILDDDKVYVSIFEGGDWTNLLIVEKITNKQNDIAVLKLNAVFDRRDFPMELALAGDVFLGQSLFFLGFPYGDFGQHFDYPEGRFPVPYVKSGILSMFSLEGNLHHIALDAINNIGFSGGPIVVTIKGGVQKTYGFVTGFKEEERLLQHAFKEGQVDHVVVAQNAGILYGTRSSIVAEMIDARKCGV
jgi:S1-C subfamily serine protease